MTYAKIQNGSITKLTPRPKWFDDNGAPVSDPVLKQHGFLPVEFDVPEHDARAYRAVVKGWSEWIVGEGMVKAQYSLEPIPFSDMRDLALARINEDYSRLTAELAQGYPDDEQKSWPVQIKEAETILAGGDEAPTPWIDSAAQSRGITREELAGLIQNQDLAYRTYHGHLTGIRQALRDQIMAVPDNDDAAQAFASIVWPSEPETT